MKKILLVIGWLLGVVLIGQPNRASAFELIELVVVVDSCNIIRNHLNSIDECREDCIDISARLVLIQEEGGQHCRLFVDGSSPRYSTPRSAHFKGIQAGTTENILDFEIDYSGVNFVYDISTSSELTQFGNYEISYSCGLWCSETKEVNFIRVDYTPPPRSGGGGAGGGGGGGGGDGGDVAPGGGGGVVPGGDVAPDGSDIVDGGVLVDPSDLPPDGDEGEGPGSPGTTARNNNQLEEARFSDQGNLQGGGSCALNPNLASHNLLNYGWFSLISLFFMILRKRSEK